MNKKLCALCMVLGLALLSLPALATAAQSWYPAGDAHRELMNELIGSINKSIDYPDEAESQIQWYKRYRGRASKLGRDARTDMMCVLKAVGSPEMTAQVLKQETSLQEMQTMFLRGPSGKHTTRLDKEAYGLEWEMLLADYYIVVMLSLPDHPGCGGR